MQEHCECVVHWFDAASKCPASHIAACPTGHETEHCPHEPTAHIAPVPLVTELLVVVCDDPFVVVMMVVDDMFAGAFCCWAQTEETPKSKSVTAATRTRIGGFLPMAAAA
ncbi:MAG TPA: hypothetical protein VL993_13565 [Stellaceae bacterium]|nr:hypothetical protein [Stellaceae bacterium]